MKQALLLFSVLLLGACAAPRYSATAWTEVARHPEKVESNRVLLDSQSTCKREAVSSGYRVQIADLCATTSHYEISYDSYEDIQRERYSQNRVGLLRGLLHTEGRIFTPVIVLISGIFLFTEGGTLPLVGLAAGAALWWGPDHISDGEPKETFYAFHDTDSLGVKIKLGLYRLEHELDSSSYSIAADSGLTTIHKETIYSEQKYTTNGRIPNGNYINREVEYTPDIATLKRNTYHDTITTSTDSRTPIADTRIQVTLPTRTLQMTTDSNGMLFFDRLLLDKYPYPQSMDKQGNLHIPIAISLDKEILWQDKMTVPVSNKLYDYWFERDFDQMDQENPAQFLSCQRNPQVTPKEVLGCYYGK